VNNIFGVQSEFLFGTIVTYVLFLLFLVIGVILLMNLLIGVAVGDIREVRDRARDKRLAMQVDLCLQMERILPAMWRRAATRDTLHFSSRSSSKGDNDRCSHLFSSHSDNALPSSSSPPVLGSCLNNGYNKTGHCLVDRVCRLFCCCLCRYPMVDPLESNEKGRRFVCCCSGALRLLSAYCFGVDAELLSADFVKQRIKFKQDNMGRVLSSAAMEGNNGDE